MTLVPHTTSVRGSNFEIVVPVKFLKPGAFDAQGLVTIPIAWLIRKVGSLTTAQMLPIESGVCNWLGLGQSA